MKIKERRNFLFFFFLRGILFCSTSDRIQSYIQFFFLKTQKYTFELAVVSLLLFFHSQIRKIARYSQSGLNLHHSWECYAEKCCLVLKGPWLRLTQLAHSDSCWQEHGCFGHRQWSAESGLQVCALCTGWQQAAFPTVALSTNRLTGHMLWGFFTACDFFLYGNPIDRKLDLLRNQSVSYAEVALRRYDSLGQNMCKAINPQNARLIILPCVIALKYSFIMEML